MFMTMNEFINTLSGRISKNLKSRRVKAKGKSSLSTLVQQGVEV